MPASFNQYYVAVLYVVLGTLIVANVFSLLGGSYLAVIPLVLESAVVFGLLTRKTWTANALIAWSVLAIVSGVALWLAIILRGTITQSTTVLIVRSALLFIGLFFAVFAKSALRHRGAEI